MCATSGHLSGMISEPSLEGAEGVRNLGIHSGRYGHNNETLILQIFGFIKQFYTYFIPYDMNWVFKNALNHLIW